MKRQILTILKCQKILDNSDVVNRIKQEELEGDEISPVPMRRGRAARNMEREAEEVEALKKQAKAERSYTPERAESRLERAKRNASKLTRHDEMGLMNELRLGVRNTFNLPTKFYSTVHNLYIRCDIGSRTVFVHERVAAQTRYQ